MIYACRLIRPNVFKFMCILEHYVSRITYVASKPYAKNLPRSVRKLRDVFYFPAIFDGIKTVLKLSRTEYIRFSAKKPF